MNDACFLNYLKYVIRQKWEIKVGKSTILLTISDLL